jgi:CheY-like chemotaxis protein
LGLTTAYSVIQRHAGYLTVESELGKGTTFHIYLPAATQGRMDAAFPQAARPVMGQGRILIMDDEAVNLEVFQRMLKNMGYRSVCAQNGTETIALFAAAQVAGTPFDAVILDLTVPGGMGGKETLVQLLKMDPTVKAIAASGYSNDPVMTEPTHFGFKASLFKPPTKNDLGRLLGAILNESSA